MIDSRGEQRVALCHNLGILDITISSCFNFSDKYQQNVFHSSISSLLKSEYLKLLNDPLVKGLSFLKDLAKSPDLLETKTVKCC